MSDKHTMTECLHSNSNNGLIHQLFVARATYVYTDYCDNKRKCFTRWLFLGFFFFLLCCCSNVSTKNEKKKKMTNEKKKKNDTKKKVIEQSIRIPNGCAVICRTRF